MVNGTTDSTVTLSWMTTAQPNGVVVRYDVQYRRAGTSSSFMTRSFTSLSGTLTGLTNDTVYEFRVAAVAVVGTGPYTTFINQKTGIKTVYHSSTHQPLPYTDGPPANIVATVLSSTSIRVTWDPLSTLSLVTNYFISYDGDESFADGGSETVDQSTTSVIINGLAAFVSYDITVQAVYSGRSGPASDAVRVRVLSNGK